MTLLEYYMLDGASSTLTKHHHVYPWGKSRGFYDSRGAQVMVWDRFAVFPDTTAPDPKLPHPQQLSIDSTTLGPSHGALWLQINFNSFTSC